MQIATHRVPHLGGQHDVVTMSDQRLTQDGLGCAVVVHVCRVEQRDATIERAGNHAMALVDVGVAPVAEHHRAEGDGGDLETAVSEHAFWQRHTIPACCLNTMLSQ